MIMAARVQGRLDRGEPAPASAGRDGRGGRVAEAEEARRDGAIARSTTPDEECGSERTCVVTGEKGPPEAMLRFALSGPGEVAPDIRRKLPGRGVWTRLDARDRASGGGQAGVFPRLSHQGRQRRADLAETVDGCSSRTRLQFLSIVNKAGLVVAGARKVEAAIAAGRIVALIHARDGASDGAAKLERLRADASGEAADAVATNKSLLFAPIGFGIGEDKCDTCSAQCGRGERGLPREGRAA